MIVAAARAALVAALLIAGIPAAPGGGDVCVCATARESNGWCPVHGLGYVGGLKITSHWLYEAVDAHGHDVDVSTYVCPSCRRAIATDGFCDEHKIGFIHEKAYFSRLTYELGRGTIRRPEEIACGVCRKNSESHGWCARHNAGMVGLVTIRDRAAFDRAVDALRILEIANAAAQRCEHCAVAIITDTECPICKIRYKDGKAVTSSRTR